MEIRKLNSQKSIKDKIKSFKKSNKTPGDVSIKQSPFYDKLLEVTEVREVHLELDKLLEEIDDKGKKFAREPELENLQEYKSLIKAFMDMVIEKMYKIREKTGPRSFIKQKVYVTVDIINKKLEELTENVLDKEKDHIKLLAKLDEIRGLLVDLYK